MHTYTAKVSKMAKAMQELNVIRNVAEKDELADARHFINFVRDAYARAITKGE